MRNPVRSVWILRCFLLIQMQQLWPKGNYGREMTQSPFTTNRNISPSSSCSFSLLLPLSGVICHPRSLLGSVGGRGDLVNSMMTLSEEPFEAWKSASTWSDPQRLEQHHEADWKANELITEITQTLRIQRTSESLCPPEPLSSSCSSMRAESNIICWGFNFSSSYFNSSFCMLPTHTRTNAHTHTHTHARNRFSLNPWNESWY